ncbi:MAG: dUTP diphosphatase [Oscillospiraceae bacterium]|nr:dUTP diphosphatase [Oscillospiraceae bacterium]
MELKIKRLTDTAILPTRGTSGSAGYDLYADIEDDVTINPRDIVKVKTGVAIALPSAEFGAFIFARSGLSIKHGISPANCVGVVDSDYRGEIMVGLTNFSNEPYTIKKGERIAQMIIMPVVCPPLLECDNLDDTERGAGGFGSTGK